MARGAVEVSPNCFFLPPRPLTQRSSKFISDDLYSTAEYEIEFYRRYVGEIFMDGKSALSHVHFLKINVL